jgi:hypothetical protein
MIGFLPQISAIEPQIGVTAVKPRMKALPTQMYPDSDPREATIAGTAVVTIVMSNAESKADRHSDAIVKAMFVRESSIGFPRSSSSWLAPADSVEGRSASPTTWSCAGTTASTI